MDETVNPYAAPVTEVPFEPTVPETHRAGRLRYSLGIIFAIVMVIGTIPAAIVAQYEIESIIFSGASMFIAALILIGLAFKPSMRALIVVAIASVLIVIACFLTIFLNQWSPTQAAKPIGQFTIGAAAFMQLGWFPILWTVSKRNRRVIDPDEVLNA